MVKKPPARLPNIAANFLLPKLASRYELPSALRYRLSRASQRRWGELGFEIAVQLR